MLWCAPTRRWACRSAVVEVDVDPPSELDFRPDTKRRAALALALSSTFSFGLALGPVPTTSVASFAMGFTRAFVVVVVHVNGNHWIEPTGQSKLPHLSTAVEVADVGILHH